MSKIILMRHGQSIWNNLNKFTGLTDVKLTDLGRKDAYLSGLKMKDIIINKAYTSKLMRAKNTCEIVMTLNKTLNYNLIYEYEELNERDYGELTGKNKEEISKQYGIEQVHKWRRGFNTKPPGGESLSEVCIRVNKFYKEELKKNILNGENILIAAHGNSLRALFVVLGICDEEMIEKIDIPTSKPFIIEYFNEEIINYGYLSDYEIKGRQILDSRGNPTIEVDIYENNKLISRESCPSGASTGTNEALELRDGKEEYFGKGVNEAISNLNKINKLIYLDKEKISNLKDLDLNICKLDGTELKLNIGGNTTTGLSYAFAAAGANISNMELFEYFNKVYNSNKEYKLPIPLVNILNGGKHAGGKLKIQEFMIMPKEGMIFPDMVKNICKVYHNLKKILVEKYGLSAKNLGDEGGFAPQLNSPDEALNVLEEAIEYSGLKVGEDMFIALDCAASEYFNERLDFKYEIEEDKYLDTFELVDYYCDLIERHPALKSIEDPFDEFDYEGWIEFTRRMSDKIMIVGDDLFTTNYSTIKEGLEKKYANALLLKVNQIGTITEAVKAAKLMFENNMNVIVSHRSGETTSSLIADLAVGIGAKYIKTGAPARGERVVKYNRLLQIYEKINY
jgi:enolase